jgi:hypothetical protein
LVWIGVLDYGRRIGSPRVRTTENVRIPDLAVTCSQDDGSWPAEASIIEAGDLVLRSIELTLPLAAIDRTTRLATA